MGSCPDTDIDPNFQEKAKFRRTNSSDDALHKVIRATKATEKVSRLEFLTKNHFIAT